MNKSDALESIAAFYLESSDFNGIPMRTLASKLNANLEEVAALLSTLISEDLVTVLGASEVNSHILRCEMPSKDTQIANLKTPDEYHTCIYLRSQVMSQFVSDNLYIEEPYRRELALGEPQLSFRAFDLSVLEFYRNDPRYLYHANDMSGRICIADEHFQSGTVVESDEILLETFGFAYDDDMNRAVAVFLRYLGRLSPEHQQIWKAKQLSGSYKLHPIYSDSSLYGAFPTHISIHDAFLAELFVINCMATVIGRERLFRQDYGKYFERKPPKFSFLIRPTVGEFNSYVLLLDQLLSDNINVRIFANDIELEREIARTDGKIEVQRKGTIQILDEWVREYFSFEDYQSWEDCIACMKRVRKLRQKPAHVVDEDRFDQKYFKDQRDLILSAYKALRTLRLLFANLPDVIETSIDVPSTLVEGKILTH